MSIGADRADLFEDPRQMPGCLKLVYALPPPPPQAEIPTGIGPELHQ